jgi:hypothetical protein
MVGVDASVATVVVLLLGMAVLTLAVGVYLLVTNPPKNPDKLVGFGEEKLTDDELERR